MPFCPLPASPAGSSAAARQTGAAGLALLLLLLLGAPDTRAETAPATGEDSTEDERGEDRSPWLATPLISSNPKFGSSIGALGAYLKTFDKKSPVSTFGLRGNYSTTHSYTLGAFANAFFDEDRQRVLGVLIWGHIENDYEDFLGTGFQFQTSDDVYLAFGRYLYRVAGNWFIGAQAVITDYTASSNTSAGDTLLDYLGLSGFQSNGLGLAVTYDSRDNTRSASSGSEFKANNIAYREALGGDEDFGVYNALYNLYRQWFGPRQVSALQLKGRWTRDAPSSAYSSIELSGYTRGEYLAEYMNHAQWDQRISFTERWGMSLTGGVACLYGDDVFDNDQDCLDRDNLYPTVAAGAIFTLKPEAKLVSRAEVAVGKGSNVGFILRFGQPF